MQNEILDVMVIIPTYKRPGSLRAAIQSAVSQGGVTKRIIVADDCPDGSAAEVARDFPEVIYLENPKPSAGWPGRVRNFAFEYSLDLGLEPSYVHFLDDDDTLPDHHYLTVKQAFERHPGIGVVFGVLRPFCRFSDDPERRKRQERQLDEVQDWRIKAGRFPWLYERFGATLGLPTLTQWLLRQHATFGSEMFLCSGGVIRHAHVVQLGGFPDIRITQDYFFYTEAIRRFGAVFLKQETAGYGVGDVAAIWNPLDLSGAAKSAHTTEWMRELRLRQRRHRSRMGYFAYYLKKIIYRLQELLLSSLVIPVLDRRGYFDALYCIIDPRRHTRSGSVSGPSDVAE